MLRATRQLLRSGGRTAFTVIHVAPGLPPGRRRRAIDAGPWAVGTRSRDYPTLLTSAGFGEVEQIDVTDDYRTTLERWLRHARRLGGALAALEPAGCFAERIEERETTRAAVAQGLLRRGLFVARR